jgi:hypothetical protein
MPSKINYHFLKKNKDIEHGILDMIEEKERRGPRGPQGLQGERGITGNTGLNLDFDMLTKNEKDDIRGNQGVKGNSGEDLKWNKLTRNQISELTDNIVKNIDKDNNILKKIKGPIGNKGEIGQKGEHGIMGVKGQPFKYTDYTKDQLDFLRGEKGIRGITGYSPKHKWFNNRKLKFSEVKNGKVVWGQEVDLVGPKGELGKEGQKGQKGQKMKFNDLNYNEKKMLIGSKGQKGEQGIQGIKGPIGNTPQLQFMGTKLHIGDKNVDGSIKWINSMNLIGQKGTKGEKGSNTNVCYEYSLSDKNISDRCYDKIWEESGCKGPYPRDEINKNETLSMIKDKSQDIYKRPSPTSKEGLNLEYYNQQCFGQGSYSEEEIYSINRVGPRGKEGQKGKRGMIGIQGPIGNTPELQFVGTKLYIKNKDLNGQVKWDQYKDLVGEKGDRGEIGIKGDKGGAGKEGKSIIFSKLSVKEKKEITGYKGDKGDKGDFGRAGLTGPKGEQGIVGNQGPIGKNLTFDALTQKQKEDIKGPKGQKGKAGMESQDGSTVHELVDELADSLLGMYNMTKPFNKIRGECIDNKLFDTRSNDANNNFYNNISKGLTNNDDLNKCMFTWDYVSCKDNKLDKIGNNYYITKTNKQLEDKKLLDYRGCENKNIVDNIEYTCLNWEKEVSGKDGTNYDYVGNHNYFRNPDGKTQPWCFKKPYVKGKTGLLGKKTMWRNGNEGYKKIMKDNICKDNEKKKNVFKNSDTLNKCYNACLDEASCNYFRFNNITKECYNEVNLNTNNICKTDNINEINTDTYQMIDIQNL